jgi:hypothetical protein
VMNILKILSETLWPILTKFNEFHGSYPFVTLWIELNSLKHQA